MQKASGICFTMVIATGLLGLVTLYWNLDKTMHVQRYDETNQLIWDEFVRASKNGTFLFQRHYMDYHRDRFSDHSILVWDDKDQLLALLPANAKDNILVSHGGLTYGGFILDEKMKTATMLEVFGQTLIYLKHAGFQKVIYKAVPHIYHRLPAEEDSYALFRFGAVLYRRDVTTTVVPVCKTAWQDRRIRSLKKSRLEGITWGLSDDYAQFWPVLEQNLSTVHNLRPVHSLDEIRRLQAYFPAQIKLYCAFLNGEIIAGTVIYESNMVAHAQYTASSDLGRNCGALDLLFFHLLTEVYLDKPYFDFGVSTESDGLYLNEGLVGFKEGFGGRTVTHDFYSISIS